MVIFIQNYYFRYNSYYKLEWPLVNRLEYFDSISTKVSPVDIFALLSPLLIFVINFANWGDFYIKRYGILNFVRSKSVSIYIAGMYIKLILNIFFFVLIQVCVWFVFFNDFSDLSLKFILKQVLDYSTIIFGIIATELLCQLFFDKTLSILLIDCGIIIICLSKINVGSFAIIFEPLRLVFEYNDSYGILLTCIKNILIYFITVICIKRTDII